MYAGCLGLYKEEDLKKALDFFKANNIKYRLGDALTLFETDECDYILTQIHEVVDENNEPIEVTEDIIEDSAKALSNADYIDNDWLHLVVKGELKKRNLFFKQSIDYGYYAEKKLIDRLEIGDLVTFPNGAGEDIELAQWLDEHTEPFKVSQIEKETERCFIENCPYAINVNKIAKFINIGF